jgi:hypothetical protein
MLSLHSRKLQPIHVWHVTKNLLATYWFLSFLSYFGEYWTWNIYLLTCGSMIKMKWCSSTSNYKILYLIMLTICRKNLTQRDLMDCRSRKCIIGGEPELLSMFWNSIEIRWIGLFYAKVWKWEGCIVKIQSPRSHKKQMHSWFSYKIISTRGYLEKLVIQ